MNDKARILFVDDEKRVLNSMRGLFRREFELFLTTDGAEAVKLAAEQSVDVIVADQRMPGLTGIEVLGKVKELSPRTVRILLTGYADPEAVEGSINIGEVFRFLSKPCPPQLLRDTLQLAVEASRSTQPACVERQPVVEPPPASPEPPVLDQPASFGKSADMAEPARTVAETGTQPTMQDSVSRPEHDDRVSAQPTAPPMASRETTGQHITPPPAPESQMPTDRAAQAPAPPTDPDASSSHWGQATNIVLSGDTSQEIRAPNFGAAGDQDYRDVGIVFFTVDPDFVETAMRTAAGDRSVTLATSLAKVAHTIERKEAGVLITDFTTNNAMLQRMIGTLKQQLPELVTIVASNGRDTTDMIGLINHGQVFRYILKPIEPEILMCEINAAAIKHLDLLNNPDSAKRHQVVELADPDDAPKTLNRFVSRIRKLRAGQYGPRDPST